MGNKIYGYIRISTREQNADRQRIALENFGVPTENFFIDKQSGKDFVPVLRSSQGLFVVCQYFAHVLIFLCNRKSYSP